MPNAFTSPRFPSGGAWRSRRFDSPKPSGPGFFSALARWTLKRAEARAPSPNCTGLDKRQRRAPIQAWGKASPPRRPGNSHPKKSPSAESAPQSPRPAPSTPSTQPDSPPCRRPFPNLKGVAPSSPAVGSTQENLPWVAPKKVPQPEAGCAKLAATTECQTHSQLLTSSAPKARPNTSLGQSAPSDAPGTLTQKLHQALKVRPNPLAPATWPVSCSPNLPSDRTSVLTGVNLPRPVPMLSGCKRRRKLPAESEARERNRWLMPNTKASQQMRSITAHHHFFAIRTPPHKMQFPSHSDSLGF